MERFKQIFVKVDTTELKAKLGLPPDCFVTGVQIDNEQV